MSSVMPRFKRHEASTVDRNAERIKRSAQVLEAYVTGLCLRAVKVEMSQGGGAPAWSSSNKIWFDATKIGDLTKAENVASLKGLTLHESAHILLTPQDGSELRQWVTEKRLFRAFNALEDQRIESLLVATFPPIRHWLTYTIAQHLLANSETIGYAFPLIRGRKYLSVDIRRAVRDAYVKQDDVQELSDIIDAYRTLNLAKESEQELAKPLIERFNTLVSNLPPMGGHGDEGEADPNAEPVDSEGGRPGFPSEGSQDSESEADGGSDGEPDEEEIDEDGSEAGGWSVMPDPNGHGNRADEADTNVTSRPWNKQKQEKASDKVKDEKFEDEADAEPSPSQLDALKDAIDLIANEVSDTLERLGDQIADDIALYSGEALLEGESLPEPERMATREMKPDADAVNASIEFGAELLRLRAEYDPSWVRRTGSGRVNAARWERGCDWEEAFDRFQFGREDATDIECVIVLDVSGSMATEANHAYQSMWAIKNALDGIDASTTVIPFSDQHYLLYGADEPAGYNFLYGGSLGGTQPFKAVQYAKSVLANSTRAIKLFIAITDGTWSDVEKTEALISDLRDGGVATALAYISDRVSPAIDNHKCEVSTHVTKSSDLFSLAQNLVEVAIERNLAH